MGCYGIGVTRIVAAAIEQGHDKWGIIFPLAIAPYSVAILPMAVDGEVLEAAEKLYADLSAAGIDVLMDDRDLRPGVKFKDADLIGIPLRVVVGAKGLKEGAVELKHRAWRRRGDDPGGGGGGPPRRHGAPGRRVSPFRA